MHRNRTRSSNVTKREAAFYLKNNRVALMNARFPQMPWPKSIPKHIHMTLPDTACDKWPTNKYCEFTGNEPARFLHRMWIASGLNSGFSLPVHNDSECDSFLREFSMTNSLWHDAHKLWSSIPYGVIKSDFWRTAFILAHGGVYSDADVEPVASLRSFVRPDDIFVTSGSLYRAQTNFHILFNRWRFRWTNFFKLAQPSLHRAILACHIWRNCSLHLQSLY